MSSSHTFPRCCSALWTTSAAGGPEFRRSPGHRDRRGHHADQSGGAAAGGRPGLRRVLPEHPAAEPAVPGRLRAARPERHVQPVHQRVVGMALFSGAFVCESVRTGINTVPIGQAEAATGDRADLHPVAAPGHPAAGVPFDDPAAGQRLDRHLDRHQSGCGRRRVRADRRRPVPATDLRRRPGGLRARSPCSTSRWHCCPAAPVPGWSERRRSPDERQPGAVRRARDRKVCGASASPRGFADSDRRW